MGVRWLKETTVGIAIVAGALLALLWGPFGLLLFGASAVCAELRYRNRHMRESRKRARPSFGANNASPSTTNH